MERFASARSPWPVAVCAVWLLLTPLRARAQSPAVPPAPLPAPTPASVKAGRALFVGDQPFANGGPACIACHSVATLPFPHGGTVGPDLTHVSAKLGPEGLDYALQTLYFPTMTALFRTRPLTHAEQVDLGAFLQQVNQSSAGGAVTVEFGVTALVGLLILLVITAFAGRGRVHSVRRRRLARTRGST